MTVPNDHDLQILINGLCITRITCSPMNSYEYLRKIKNKINQNRSDDYQLENTDTYPGLLSRKTKYYNAIRPYTEYKVFISFGTKTVHGIRSCQEDEKKKKTARSSDIIVICACLFLFVFETFFFFSHDDFDRTGVSDSEI